MRAAAMAMLAAEFYGHPSRSMNVVGITGTNGKTTTAYLLRAVFEAAGKKCGLLGTVSYSVGDEELPAARTTPEAPDVQRMFRRMVDSGCARMRDGSVVARAGAAAGRRDALCGGSVHEPDQGPSRLSRRHGVVLLGEEAAVRDAAAGAPAVINLDDPRGELLRKTAARPVTYAMNKPADVTPGPLSLTFDGLEFDARTPEGTGSRRSRGSSDVRTSRTFWRPSRPRPRSMFRCRRSSAASPAWLACPDDSR